MKNNYTFYFIAILFFNLLTLFGYSQIQNVSYSSSVDVYGEFEISFDLPAYNNPYDSEEIDVYAKFVGPSGQAISVNAFFYEYVNKSDNGSPTSLETLSLTGTSIWKVRFTPTIDGVWEFKLIASDVQNNITYNYPSVGYDQISVSSSSDPGFISLANDRYLKKSDGSPYYPIGLSLPWAERQGLPWRGNTEYGTNYIKNKIDVLEANGIDFFRFEINIGGFLNLYGWDFITEKNYCKFYNQIDSWKLDEIIDYAKSKDINMVISLFSQGDMGDRGNVTGYVDANNVTTHYNSIDSQGNVFNGYPNGAWSLYHPYNKYISQNHKPVFPDEGLDLLSGYEWYSSLEAKKEQKKLLRYIVSRWGGATNILAWELMDEADRIDWGNPNDLHPNYVPVPSGFNNDIITWHDEMVNYIKNIDVYDHLVTTGYANHHRCI